MERIAIEVADTTAKKWQTVPPKIKSQLEKSFAKQIELISERAKESNLEDLLKIMREEATENGLTEEILQQMLNEE